MTRWIYTVSKSRGTIYVAVVEGRQDWKPANSNHPGKSRSVLGGGRFEREKEKGWTNSSCLSDYFQGSIHFTVDQQISIALVTGDVMSK
jgi:hypothetical protein